MLKKRPVTSRGKKKKKKTEGVPNNTGNRGQVPGPIRKKKKRLIQKKKRALSSSLHKILPSLLQ